MLAMDQNSLQTWMERSMLNLEADNVQVQAGHVCTVACSGISDFADVHVTGASSITQVNLFCPSGFMPSHAAMLG